jgi:hypothetical protein
VHCPKRERDCACHRMDLIADRPNIGAQPSAGWLPRGERDPEEQSPRGSDRPSNAAGLTSMVRPIPLPRGIGLTRERWHRDWRALPQ